MKGMKSFVVIVVALMMTFIIYNIACAATLREAFVYKMTKILSRKQE